MPRTAIPVDVLPIYGTGVATLSGVAADATNDHDMENNGKTLILLENNSGGAVTATVLSVVDPFGRTGDITMSAAALASDVPGKSIAGPFLPSVFNQGGGSKLHVDTAAGSTIRIYGLRFQPPN